MTEISNLKINELSNVERPNLGDSLQQKIKIEEMKRRNSFISTGASMRIGKITSDAQYRMNE